MVFGVHRPMLRQIANAPAQDSHLHLWRAGIRLVDPELRNHFALCFTRQWHSKFDTPRLFLTVFFCYSITHSVDGVQIFRDGPMFNKASHRSSARWNASCASTQTFRSCFGNSKLSGYWAGLFFPRLAPRSISMTLSSVLGRGPRHRRAPARFLGVTTNPDPDARVLAPHLHLFRSEVPQCHYYTLFSHSL